MALENFIAAGHHRNRQPAFSLIRVGGDGTQATGHIAWLVSYKHEDGSVLHAQVLDCGHHHATTQEAMACSDFRAILENFDSLVTRFEKKAEVANG